MSTASNQTPKNDVVGQVSPRTSPRGSGWGGGCYYVTQPTSPPLLDGPGGDSPGNRPRQPIDPMADEREAERQQRLRQLLSSVPHVKRAAQFFTADAAAKAAAIAKGTPVQGVPRA